MQPSYPTTRVLTLLELLQTYGRMSAPDLARRLAVAERTVRRYIIQLQDLGIPVEGERGRYGAYRLRPGFKLPPLMFNEDEALALVLGLLVVRQSGIAGTVTDVEGALAKVERVMPDSLRSRVRAVQEVVVLAGASQGMQPSGTIIGVLSEAAYQQRRVWLRYRSRQAEQTERELDPYGVVYRGVWYVTGYDHLRGALRTFRVDRVLAAELRTERFVRPTDFDALAQVEHAIAMMPGVLTIEVLLETTLEEARGMLSAATATLEQTPRGVLARGQVQDARDLDAVAHALARLACPLVVLQPPELRDELRKLAAHAVLLAERTVKSSHCRPAPDCGQ